MSAPDSIRSAQAYWDTAANAYEDDFSGTLIGQTLRHAVWRDLDHLFRPGQRVLELNCGTGIDAVHLVWTTSRQSREILRVSLSRVLPFLCA
jgi:ubiquinone/menaquinone biosynthesis C-methylase UbiE